jgi:undecaprenyl-diphosphatase
LLKTTIHRPRPGLFPQLTSAGGDSFPSGHTAGSAAVYGVLAIAVGTSLSVSARRRLFAGVVVWVGLVATSRILLGVHYPTDVLGGAALGILWLALALTLLPPDSWREQNVRNRPTDGDGSGYLRLT